MFGLGRMSKKDTPGLDHAQARVATDFLVVGSHEFAEELERLGDAFAEDIEASAAKELLVAFGVGASLGAEFGAGVVQLQADVFPGMAFGAQLGDEFEQVGIGWRRRNAWSNHGKPSVTGRRSKRSEQREG